MCISYAVRQRHRKPVTDCYSMDSFACGFETRASPSMARAQRITLRPWLAFCGALQVDKRFQSASPCGRASWTFIVTVSPLRRISSHEIANAHVFAQPFLLLICIQKRIIIENELQKETCYDKIKMDRSTLKDT